MSRATRRQHHARMIARTRRFLANAPWGAPDEAHVRRQAEDRKMCSCPLCGHRRRHWGAPVRELRDPSVSMDEQATGDGPTGSC